MKAEREKGCFAEAVRRSLPVMVGYFPVGMAFGILMADAGYGVWTAGASSLFVFAGSLQMLMVSFLTAAVPLLTAAVTALLLNSRHIFYGLSFLETFRAYGKWKYFLIFTLTDETYSLLCQYHADRPQSRRERKITLWCAGLNWAYWVLFSVLGGVLGTYLPFDTAGIDFALTALFLVILTDQLRAQGTRRPVCIAAAASLLSMAVFGTDAFLLPAMLITSAALLLLCPPAQKPSAPAASDGEEKEDAE